MITTGSVSFIVRGRGPLSRRRPFNTHHTPRGLLFTVVYPRAGPILCSIPTTSPSQDPLSRYWYPQGTFPSPVTLFPSDPYRLFISVSTTRPPSTRWGHTRSPSSMSSDVRLSCKIGSDTSSRVSRTGRYSVQRTFTGRLPPVTTPTPDRTL